MSEPMGEIDQLNIPSARERIAALEHRLSGALLELEQAKAVYRGELRRGACLERQVATLRAALERIEAMAERPRCVCGRPTGTAAIQSCARTALEAAQGRARDEMA